MLFRVALVLLALSLTAQRPAGRVLLISFDALGYQRLTTDPVAQELVSIQALLKSGAYADGLTPAFPSTTANGHAALWTGTYAGRNGILYNSTPPLPRAEHAFTERIVGFRADALTAEPIGSRPRGSRSRSSLTRSRRRSPSFRARSAPRRRRTSSSSTVFSRGGSPAGGRSGRVMRTSRAHHATRGRTRFVPMPCVTTGAWARKRATGGCMPPFAATGCSLPRLRGSGLSKWSRIRRKQSRHDAGRWRDTGAGRLRSTAFRMLWLRASCSVRSPSMPRRGASC